MPSLDVSELNIVLSILGAFTVLYGLISVKMKQKWYMGEARKFPSVFFLTPFLNPPCRFSLGKNTVLENGMCIAGGVGRDGGDAKMGTDSLGLR